ncbi:MAG: PRC-barrel domain-containing protein [Nitrososphaerales archaeon]
MSSTGNLSPVGKSVGYLKREEIIGKPVVTTDAIMIGNVKDVAVSLYGKAALQIEAKGKGEAPAKDTFVYSEDIQAIGDIILLRYASSRSEVESEKINRLLIDPQTQPPPFPVLSTTGKTCAKCSYFNTPNSRFCIKCGSPL